MFRLNLIGDNSPEAVAPIVETLTQELTDKYYVPIAMRVAPPQEAGSVFRDAIRIAVIRELVEQRITIEKRAYRFGDLVEHFSKEDGREIASSATSSLYALHKASDFLAFTSLFHRLERYGVTLDEKAVRKEIHKHLRKQPLIPYFHSTEVQSFVNTWFEGLGAETHVFAFQKPYPTFPVVNN